MQKKVATLQKQKSRIQLDLTKTLDITGLVLQNATQPAVWANHNYNEYWVSLNRVVTLT